ncbi:MAG: aspartate aminotransferase family protein [Clostridium sp.]|uniref:class-III pyridoxal-phosphate-dependent aminotransferase n=1 Tax=Clostridium sp. TaxID=1506 RepID=UPI003037DFD5
MSYLFNSTGYPIYNEEVIKGSGCYVYDSRGNKYLDLEAGVWTLPLGHNDPDVSAAMHRQIDEIIHVGYKYNHLIGEKCAQKLLKIADIDYGKCVFLTSGSEAVEYGVQLARAIRRNKKCVCLTGQYLAAYGQCMEQKESQWETISWDYHHSKSVEEYYEEISDEIDFSNIGVFVFEAGNSSGLVKLPPRNLVTAISQLAKENDVVIVVDEVTCGIGRTGKWFGYMNYNLKPQIIATGKGMGNGYPVSAVIIKESIIAEVEKTDFHFAQSHQNDPMGCRVAYEVLNKIEKLDLLCNVVNMGTYFLESYRKLQQEIPIISEIRGCGLLICIELSKEISIEFMREIDRSLFQRGFIAGVKVNERVIRTYCPLTITMEKIDSFIVALKAILVTLKK